VHSRHGFWELQSFGAGIHRHTYVHLDAPLVRDLALPFRLRKAACVDGVGQVLGPQPLGILQLEFGPLRTWYRFWACEVDDLELPLIEEEALKTDGAWLASNWTEEVERHVGWLGAEARSHPALRGRKMICEVFCGAELPVGTRSRAQAYDRIGTCVTGLTVQEHSDGVIALGPGRAFWYHPRELGLRVDGLGVTKDVGAATWSVLLHSFDPFDLAVRYVVKVGPQCRVIGKWIIPTSSEKEGAFFSFECSQADLDHLGRLQILLQTDQKQILHWWSERGFIAALHALWIGEMS
jgi:hypothetical protein